MAISRCRRAGLLATAAFCAAVSLGQARAQSVVMFEDTPSLERLRSIIIPDAPAGPSRSIVIGRQSVPDSTLAATRVSSTSTEAPVQASAPSPAPSPAPESAAPPAERANQAAPEPPRRARVPRPVRRIEEPRVLASSKPASIVGFRIPFAPDSVAVPSSSQPFLDRIAELLREQAGLKLLIEGHTDARGSAEYNLALSKRRAQAVAAYLLAKSAVSPDCLIVAGMGMSAPLVADPLDPRNRRVQFVRVE